MSNVKPEVRTAWEFPPQSRVVLAAEYEALAQRCRELEEEEEERQKTADELVAFIHQEHAAVCGERDTLRAEVERLRQALRSVIAAAGGWTAPDVSTEFLEQASLEVLALQSKIKRLQDLVDRYSRD